MDNRDTLAPEITTVCITCGTEIPLGSGASCGHDECIEEAAVRIAEQNAGIPTMQMEEDHGEGNTAAK